MMTGVINKAVSITLTGNFRSMDMSSLMIVLHVNCKGSRITLLKSQKIARTKIAPSSNNMFHLTISKLQVNKMLG